MKKYVYHPQSMHLHACNQMGASMESHMANAAALGMHYIRFTGHDTRMGRREYEIDRFDFTRHMLKYNDFGKKIVGFEEVGDIRWRFTEDTLELSADAEAGIAFTASGKRHTRPLASDVTLTLGISGNARVRLDITLSERPHKVANSNRPEHIPSHYVYELDLTEPVHTLHISADIPEELGGLDNSLAGVTLFVSGGTVRIDRLEISSAKSYNEVLEVQRETAEKIGARYGIKPFVTYEISGAGEHKCCYSTRVPMLDYKSANWHITAREAVEHMKEYDAVYSYNHPFERWKRMEHTESLHKHLFDVTLSELIATRLWGAQILEVGFPDGRSGFTLDEHLRLWDVLSMSGVFATGDGDSDSHYANLGWFSGNNFATWIAADAQSSFPVSEAEFEASLRAGNVYMGDPVYLHGQVEFAADSAPMGAVLVHTDKTANTPRSFRFSVETKLGWRVRVIADGAVLSETIADSDELTLEFEFKPRLPVSFVRVEMYNYDGRCVLLTNPIYMVNTDSFTGEIPAERVYGGEK